MPLLTETEHIMTEEELKVKFDYIQGIFNRCKLCRNFDRQYHRQGSILEWRTG